MDARHASLRHISAAVGRPESIRLWRGFNFGEEAIPVFVNSSDCQPFFCPYSPSLNSKYQREIDSFCHFPQGSKCTNRAHRNVETLPISGNVSNGLTATHCTHDVSPPPSCLTVRAASVPSVRLSVRQRRRERFTPLLEALSPGAPLFSLPWQMAARRSDPRICKAIRTEPRIVGGQQKQQVFHSIQSRHGWKASRYHSSTLV